MALKIMPHGRLQEWVADEKGYFAAEGLDYSFVTGTAGCATGPARSRPVRSRRSGPGVTALM